MNHFLNGGDLLCCGGRCTVSADHEKEEKIDKLQEKATDEEIKERKLEEIKKALRSLSSEELDDELENMKAELEDLKKNQKDIPDDKESKSASRPEMIGVSNYDSQPHYSVLMYDESTASQDGDKLLQDMGST